MRSRKNANRIVAAFKHIFPAPLSRRDRVPVALSRDAPELKSLIPNVLRLLGYVPFLPKKAVCRIPCVVKFDDSWFNANIIGNARESDSKYLLKCAVSGDFEWVNPYALLRKESIYFGKALPTSQPLPDDNFAISDLL